MSSVYPQLAPSNGEDDGLLPLPGESHPIQEAREGNQGMTMAEDEELATKLTPRVLNFYNAEMKRFLEKDVYPPMVLWEIHASLSSSLTCKFKEILNHPQSERLAWNLQELLDESFATHRQQNSNSLNRKQEMITKCLQKTMSSYMEQIEDVLIHNPYGLRYDDLMSRNDSIVDQVMAVMSTEIREKVRANENLTWHVHSIQAEVQDYWECVRTRNTQNLLRRELQKHLEDVDRQLHTKDDLLISDSQWDQFKGEWEKAKAIAENMDSSTEELVEQIGIALEWYNKYSR